MSEEQQQSEQAEQQSEQAEQQSEPGGNGESWHSQLSDEDKNLGDYERFKDVSGLWRGFAETKAMVGANTVKVPGQNATDDERKAFYAKIGRPEKSEDYQFATIEGMPEEAMPENRMEAFRQFAHQNGYTQEQASNARNLVSQWIKEDIASVAGAKEVQSKQWIEAIKNEHGEAFEQNVELARRARTDLKIPGLPEMLDETGAGNHPAMMNLLLKVAKMTGQHGLVAGEEGDFKRSPGAAKERLAAMTQNREFMHKVSNKHVDGHAAALAEFTSLNEEASPET